MAVLYSEIRDTIRTGDLISWKAGKINSVFALILKLYQKIFKTKSVHTAIALHIGGRVLVVEARPPVIRIYPLSKLDNFYLIRTNIPDEQNDLDILLQEIGVPYSALDVLKGLLYLDRDKTEIYCSELCDIYYKSINYLSEDYFDSGRTPDQLLEAVLEVSGSEPIKVIIDEENLTEV